MPLLLGEAFIPLLASPHFPQGCPRRQGLRQASQEVRNTWGLGLRVGTTQLSDARLGCPPERLGGDQEEQRDPRHEKSTRPATGTE